MGVSSESIEHLILILVCTSGVCIYNMLTFVYVAACSSRVCYCAGSIV
jgi:hypothetical protein